MSKKIKGAIARSGAQSASFGQPRIMNSHTSTGTPMPNPVTSPSPAETPKDETTVEDALSPTISTITPSTTTDSNGAVDKPKKKYSTNDKIVRAQKEVGLFVLTGIPYSGYHYAYKAYKKKSQKRKSEKAAKAEAEVVAPPEIIDPSAELTSATPGENDSLSSTRDPLHRTSTDSMSSASSTEIQQQLENDAEFKEFMKAQRQAYLSQRGSTHRADSSNSAQAESSDRKRNTRITSMSTEPDVEQPPPEYDAVWKQRGSTDRHRTSGSGIAPSEVVTADEEVVAPVELRGDNTEIRELSAEPARPPLPPRPKRSPVGFISELPGDMPVMVNKDAVELPAAADTTEQPPVKTQPPTTARTAEMK